MRETVLDVRDLTVRIASDDGDMLAVDAISYSLRPGEILGIVGESGCGKSMSALAVMGLTRFLPRVAVSGRVELEGMDLVSASREDARKVRGAGIAMVFQD